ncbi:sigma-70 family RNA polymerase sigma factor [Mangrovivirga sp. M17]|uniref:RNA polymerase subunit sigma n=2 Tax=Mangrovivirga TaxID=2858886 RepID=A0A4D7K983_9BACT|nr:MULTISPECIES: sigma-70 family RNA polymerase sigma factor [Mangrovivirga]MCX2745250.1 sigma-70 family RNA polymerase sigma factor [Mangrovivirga halotolerans]QCK15868.1 RNA polymerase subunit sigma [Mangrovivirga cuniculi]
MKDQEILERISKGDETALDYLYKKYYRMMSRIVITNSGTEEEAKDIYQEALIVFWQKVVSGNLVLTSKISTFLYSICLNLWRKELDRKSRLSREEKDNPESMDFEQEERLRIITECINELGDTCKKILTYFYFDGMSMQNIALNLGLANTDTAKTKKYKCKKRLDELVKSKYSAGDFLD